MKGKSEEVKELKHEPIPGYRAAFYVAFLVGVIYLVAVGVLSWNY